MGEGDSGGAPAAGDVDSKLETCEVGRDAKRDQTLMGRRLIVSVRAVEPGFRMLRYPHREGDALPETGASDDGSRADIAWPDQADSYAFARGADGRTRITVTRGGKAIAPVR